MKITVGQIDGNDTTKNKRFQTQMTNILPTIIVVFTDKKAAVFLIYVTHKLQHTQSCLWFTYTHILSRSAYMCPLFRDLGDFVKKK